MAQLRVEFHDELHRIEEAVLVMGRAAQDLIGQALRALGHHDAERSRAVVRADGDIDRARRENDDAILRLLALEAPVATDLRRVLALVHANLHLERIGDYCVNIARLVPDVAGQPVDPELGEQVQEMGRRAERLVSAALDVLGRRDLEGARELAAQDEPIDQLNRGLFRRLVLLAAEDDTRIDWAVTMVLVVRFLERLADHAVSAGEQIEFVVTGEKR